MDTSIPYYEDNSRISNSSIGWFLKQGPQYFKDMLDGKIPPLNLPQLEKGTMIHEYILQPDEFWKDYVILDFKQPSSQKQKQFLEQYNLLLNTEPLEADESRLLKAYTIAYANTFSTDKKLTEAKNIVNENKEYLNYLKEKDKRKVISFADLQLLKNIQSNIKEHKKANELLYGLPVTFETHNEFHINWEVSKYGVKCKSLLDRVCFDHVNKKIILIDLKTTQNVYDFAHSVDTYDYYRQIAYYGLAIQWYMSEVLNLNSEDYDFEAYIIAISKDRNNEIRVFNMFNDKIIREKVDLINKTLQTISWHFKNNQWAHTKDYYDGNGIEEL